MKTLIPKLGLLFALWLPFGSPAQTYTNPVIPGFYPDPSIVRVGGDYYLVNSTFQYFPAILISHSRDLVHWQQIGHVFTNSAELDLRGFFDGCGIWAPDISYHDGEFYIFYCLVQLKKDRSVNVRGNYMVKSRSIHGPWSKPVQLTTEGNDPSLFVDDDGTHWMCYAGGIPKGSATKIVKLNADCTKVVEGPFWIDYGGEKRAPEGPHLFKRDGYYYHTMAASGGIYNGHHQLIARSTNVLGPYEFSPHNPFIAQLDTKSPLQHHGHAKLVATQNGEWWAVYLMQRRLKGFSQLGRETGLDRVDWLADGWPVLNNGKGPSETNDIPKLPVTPQRTEQGDEFANRQLGVQWQFVRTPDYANFSLTERPGWLRLYGGEWDVDSTNARNVILQRETSQHYTATTRLEFEPVDGAQAGLLCYYDTKTYIKLALTDRGGRRLVLEECRKGVRKLLAELPVKQSGAIYLRARVAGLSRWFDYSLDGRQWREAGAVADASFLSDQGTPQWGFMGTMVGVFVVNPTASVKVPADFDWFHLDDGSGLIGEVRGFLSGYKLAWADEFEGGMLNTNKWVIRTGKRYWSAHRPENVAVADGKLRLLGLKESADGLNYTCGGIISKETFKYGYYEARFKVPAGGGWHTSFWMMKHNGRSGLPDEGILQGLDVCENDSVDLNSYGVNVHRHYPKPHLGMGHKNIATPNLAADFHVWGCEFTPETVKFFFDGKLVQTVDATKFPHAVQSIWLTTIAAPLGTTKAVDDTKLPAVAEYDYVRFYVKK